MFDLFHLAMSMTIYVVRVADEPGFMLFCQLVFIPDPVKKVEINVSQQR
jgi:hypothetical protein